MRRVPCCGLSWQGWMALAALACAGGHGRPVDAAAPSGQPPASDTPEGEAMSLQLDVHMTRTSYRAGEEIEVRVALLNLGARSARVNTRLAVSYPGRGGELSFRIEDASGAEIPFVSRVNIGQPDVTYFRDIPPRVSVGRSVPLNQYYALSAPGEYRAVATYPNTWTGGAYGDAWTGELTAEPVSFSIKP